MGENFFASHKYADDQVESLVPGENPTDCQSRKLRDDIIAALGENAIYYKGETVDSKNMTD